MSVTLQNMFSYKVRGIDPLGEAADMFLAW